MSAGIILVIFPNPLEELLGPSLLKQTHQRRPEGFTSVRGHLCNGSLGAAALLHVTSRNLSELEVSGDIGGNENVGQLSVRHEQLGHEVDVPAVDTAVFLPRFLALLHVAVHFEELLRD